MSAEYFEARERALLGERYDTLYAAPQETAARGVTVSALRTTPEGFAARADFPLRPSPFCKAAFVVHQPDFKPGRHPYHHAGVFYSQEPSASSAAPLLGVQPGMRVLDLCAAPGGKSSQLAAALQGRGVLVSNEYVAARAEILKSNLERMGVSNAVVLNETPARIAEALPEWDGIDRLEMWPMDFIGVRDSQYARMVAKWSVMAIVKRVLYPGCKHDYCLVLEGPQGDGKSSVARVFGWDWFGDTDLDINNKDALLALPGHLVYEIAEMGSLMKAEERKQKSFLSRQDDEYRPVLIRPSAMTGVD